MKKFLLERVLSKKYLSVDCSQVSAFEQQRLKMLRLTLLVFCCVAFVQSASTNYDDYMQSAVTKITSNAKLAEEANLATWAEILKAAFYNLNNDQFMALTAEGNQPSAPGSDPITEAAAARVSNDIQARQAAMINMALDIMRSATRGIQEELFKAIQSG